MGCAGGLLQLRLVVLAVALVAGWGPGAAEALSVTYAPLGCTIDGDGCTAASLTSRAGRRSPTGVPRAAGTGGPGHGWLWRAAGPFATCDTFRL